MWTLLAETPIIGDGSGVTIGLAAMVLTSAVGAAIWVGAFKADLLSQLARVINRQDTADAAIGALEIRTAEIEKTLRGFELAEAKRQGAAEARRKKTGFNVPHQTWSVPDSDQPSQRDPFKSGHTGQRAWGRRVLEHWFGDWVSPRVDESYRSASA